MCVCLAADGANNKIAVGLILKFLRDLLCNFQCRYVQAFSTISSDHDLELGSERSVRPLRRLMLHMIIIKPSSCYILELRIVVAVVAAAGFGVGARGESEPE